MADSQKVSKTMNEISEYFISKMKEEIDMLREVSLSSKFDKELSKRIQKARLRK